jgi:uncharacterized protein YlxW (UPF0749 family)
MLHSTFALPLLICRPIPAHNGVSQVAALESEVASRRSREQAEAHEAEVSRLQAQVAELQGKTEKAEARAAANYEQQAETLKVRWGLSCL